MKMQLHRPIRVLVVACLLASLPSTAQAGRTSLLRKILGRETAKTATRQAVKEGVETATNKAAGQAARARTLIEPDEVLPPIPAKAPPTTPPKPRPPTGPDRVPGRILAGGGAVGIIDAGHNISKGVQRGTEKIADGLSLESGTLARGAIAGLGLAIWLGFGILRSVLERFGLIRARRAPRWRTRIRRLARRLLRTGTRSARALVPSKPHPAIHS